MKCANCQGDIHHLDTDYLCRHCRVALNPVDWDDRKRVMDSISAWLTSRGKMFYGHEVMFPDGSPWAWVRIYDDPGLAHPETLRGVNATSGDVMRAYAERLQMPMYVVWKHNGDVYEIGSDGAVRDDPIFRLTNPS